MNAFHSRLRQLSATCDVDKEIKSQIILSCSSQRLRRKALRDTTMTLETLLNEARAREIWETQAKDIESSGNAANALLPTPSQPKKNCFSCGGIWPYDSKTGFPARNRKCNSCHKCGHCAKCCTQKSHETRNSRKGKQPRGRANPKEMKKQNVKRLEAECEERETLSSSDGEYTFRLEVPASKVSAPFVSLKVNGVVCKFLVDSGVSVNIVSSNAVKVFGVDLQPCGTRVYAFNSSAPLLVIGKFSALIESKCSAVNAEFVVVESETSLLGYTTATELGILQITNAVSLKKNAFQRYPSLFTGLGKMKNVEVDVECEAAYRWKCESCSSNTSKNSFSPTQNPRGLCRALASTGHN